MWMWRVWAAAAAGAASLVASAVILLAGKHFRPGNTVWALAEIALLMLLAFLSVRVVPAGWWFCAALLPAVAVPAWLLRFGWGPVNAEVAGGFVAWTLAPLTMVSFGLYLRGLDKARIRSVAEARREQRLRLASDLHDFVAHDVSGMLAQAQAGQLLAEHDPAAAVAAFRRIESAGMQAMMSLDRTVHMLRDTDDGMPEPPASLGDIPGLVARFASTVDVDLEIEPGLENELSREAAATVYRVIVEALTNVRRHASRATRVGVYVRREGAAVRVCLTDDAPPATGWGLRFGGSRRGGIGLPGLAERVEALGGTLTAGPEHPTGWRVTATLPLAGDGGGRGGAGGVRAGGERRGSAGGWHGDEQGRGGAGSGRVDVEERGGTDGGRSDGDGDGDDVADTRGGSDERGSGGGLSGDEDRNGAAGGGDARGGVVDDERVDRRVGGNGGRVTDVRIGADECRAQDGR